MHMLLLNEIRKKYRRAVARRYSGNSRGKRCLWGYIRPFAPDVFQPFAGNGLKVVGSGYPYPLETADALAVLNVHDREQFYRIYQEHLDELSIPLHLARKTASKRRRR